VPQRYAAALLTPPVSIAMGCEDAVEMHWQLLSQQNRLFAFLLLIGMFSPA
jgi:hypothetical protein